MWKFWLLKDWKAYLALNVISNMLTFLITYFMLQNGDHHWTASQILLFVYVTAVGTGAFIAGRKSTQQQQAALAEIFKQDKETLQKQYDGRIRSLHQEIVDLKKSAIFVSVCQPKGISFVPATKTAFLDLNIKCATPLEIKDAQATAYVEGYPMVFKLEEALKLPVCAQARSFRLRRIVESDSEREALLKLAHDCKEVPIKTSTVNVRGDDIGAIERNVLSDTFIEIINPHLK